MKTIYLSGKIAGLDYVTAQENFTKAEEELWFKFINDRIEVINPLLIPNVEGMKWMDFILCDLIYLAKCDAIYMLRNWQDSPGARVEHEFAKGLGIEIIYQDERTKG